MCCLLSDSILGNIFLSCFVLLFYNTSFGIKMSKVVLGLTPHFVQVTNWHEQIWF